MSIRRAQPQDKNVKVGIHATAFGDPVGTVVVLPAKVPKKDVAVADAIVRAAET